MNALTLRGIVAEELGILKLHAVGKRGGLGELRQTIWAREGKSGGYRSILIFRSGERAIFVFAFAKSDKPVLSACLGRQSKGRI